MLGNSKPKVPTGIHYCGHMFAPRRKNGLLTDDFEATVSVQIDQALKQHHVTAGFGSLACGSDILFAERLLAREAALHVYLPFDQGDFEAVSVRPGQGEWQSRFHRCLSQATSCIQTFSGRYHGDVELFKTCSVHAMADALAFVKKDNLTARQIAVWNGRKSKKSFGTGADVAHWRSLGFPVTIISPSTGSE